MARTDYAAVLADLQSQQGKHPLSILKLADPIITSTQNAVSPSKRASDASNSEIENPTPASLEADLLHYKDLFSKLHFSYLEQVTKEKFLRSIVGDPPLLVSHSENVALENTLIQQKAELKAAKEEVNVLAQEMEAMARHLASRWEGVQTQMAELERLPAEIEGLEAVINELREQQDEREGRQKKSEDPRMNLSLPDTEKLVRQQKEESAALDKQIAALQRQMPAKTRECEMAERELEALEKRRSEVSAAASAARRIKAEGGRDELEEKGRWYQSAETVLRGLVDVDA
jgi:DNA repair exonuclease SbcCD ATPase subunit